LSAAERRAVFETPAGSVTIETPEGVHAIAPSTLELARKIDVRPGERVLELGCGSGLLSIVAAKLGAASVVAVDIDESACRAARENARLNGVALDVRQGRFLEALRGERFDVVLFVPPQTPFAHAFGPKWGGEDGALHFREVLPRIQGFLRPGGRVLLLALSLVDPRALDELFGSFSVELRGESERTFEASEYEGYAKGLVAYLEGRARAGSALLERKSATSYAFKNRYYRLCSRWSGVRLVVNADDLGLDGAHNEGVIAAFERGIVRSTSLMANGAALEDALARLEKLKAGRSGPLDTGLHANLSQGRAVSGPIAGLTTDAGEFAGSKHEAWRRLASVDAGSIERELEAQIALVAARGVRVSHLDGHQHVHAFGAARVAAIGVASRHSLALRVPDEAPCAFALKGGIEGELDQIRSAAGDLRREVASARGVRVCRSFRGLAARVQDTGCAVDCFRESLADLPESGVVELMVHPAARGPNSLAAGEAELEALTDPSWPDWLAERGIALASFADDAFTP
jgi:predicted glycoside hydrolase/deacetylase ChbG (UPF0249 family)